ncbi:MAG: DNA replication/repair protein RecF [Actinobacteria bacterium]|nr:DNA replication/repair protein RecF [Actinomycetota bacterium]
MQIDWLALTRFRSYDILEWSPAPGVNLLVGPNGAGKTNLLEAMAYLASLRSFRGVPDSALVAEGETSSVIRSGVSSDDRQRLIEIELSTERPRRTQVDKTPLRRSSDLLGVLRVIAFLPDDLDLVKRGPAQRRDLLDEIAVQLWPASHLDQAEYERAVRQRNAFLKAGEREDTTLGVWDSRLAQAGGRVLARRARVVERVGPLLETAYQEISGEDETVGLGYLSTWGAELVADRSAAEYAGLISEALVSVRAGDYQRRVTTVGPHRDDPALSIGGRDARTHSSQGEQRSLALAIKLAAHRAVAEAAGEPPVLLLDDVFSELDPERAAALTKALPAGAQTVITSARPDEVPVPGQIWSVQDGEIS